MGTRGTCQGKWLAPSVPCHSRLKIAGSRGAADALSQGFPKRCAVRLWCAYDTYPPTHLPTPPHEPRHHPDQGTLRRNFQPDTGTGSGTFCLYPALAADAAASRPGRGGGGVACSHQLRRVAAGALQTRCHRDSRRGAQCVFGARTIPTRPHTTLPTPPHEPRHHPDQGTLRARRLQLNFCTL
jgi:hypothetical protein